MVLGTVLSLGSCQHSLQGTGIWEQLQLSWCPGMGSEGLGLPVAFQVSRNKGNVVPELWPLRLCFPLGKQNSLWTEVSFLRVLRRAIQGKGSSGIASAAGNIALGLLSLCL